MEKFAKTARFTPLSKLLRLHKLSIRNKILLVAAAGCIGFIVNLLFNGWTSMQTNDRLYSIQEMHFPLLESTDRTISLVDQLNTSIRESLNPVIFDDASPANALDSANQIANEIQDSLTSILLISVDQQAGIESLSVQIDDYIGSANSLLDSKLNNSVLTADQDAFELEDQLYDLEDSGLSLSNVFLNYRTETIKNLLRLLIRHKPTYCQQPGSVALSRLLHF